MTETELIELWRATRPHADWETRAAGYGRAVEAVVAARVWNEAREASYDGLGGYVFMVENPYLGEGAE